MGGRGHFGKGCGIVGFVLLGGGLASSALADSFHLTDGQVIEGTVLRGTINTLTVQADSGIQFLTLAQIERAVIELADGSELSGDPISWNDGVFEIRAGGEVLKVADGALLSDQASTAETSASETAPRETAKTAAAPAAPAATSAVEFSGETLTMGSLPNFTMKNGDVLVGKILHDTGSVMTIKVEGASAQPISRAQIETLSFENAAGEVISGKLIDWEDNVYELQLEGDRRLLASLPGDAAVRALSPSVAAAPDVVAEAEPIEQPKATEMEAADGTRATADAGVQTPAEVGAGGPANEIAVAGLTEDQAAQPAPEVVVTDEQHLIETLVDSVDEGGSSAIVRFQLSKPAARPLVVLYAATEASATAGKDFEAKSGVITFATGSSYAEVQVPIIDDDEGEGSEKFNLFLSGDPETIAFSKRQIAVTINDND